MSTKGAQSVDYRIEKRDAVRVIGKRIQLKPTLEGMCRKWNDSSSDIFDGYRDLWSDGCQ